MNAAAMINDYERLRAAALTSRSASGSRQRLKLVGEGLHAWLMARSDAQAPTRTPTSSGMSPGRNLQLSQRHDMVQLLASMALQSLAEDTHVYLQ